MEAHLKSGDDRRAVKNMKTSLRSIALARRFIHGVRGSDLFLPLEGLNVPLVDLQARLVDEMQLLEEDAERSGLPSLPDPEPFRNYILRIRLRYLRSVSDGTEQDGVK